MGPIKPKQKTPPGLFLHREPNIGELPVIIDGAYAKLQVVTRGPVIISVRQQNNAVLIIVGNLAARQPFPFTPQEPFPGIEVNGNGVAKLIRFGFFSLIVPPEKLPLSTLKRYLLQPLFLPG